MTPQLDDIYVPLAIVERKPPKPPSRNQPEEKEEEKLIPIAEERFFEDVLRQGKSQISQGRKIAIIGEPGSGKTTRLQKIADWILEQDLGWPIWVSLADLTQPTITQYIEEVWLKQIGKSLTIDELTQQKHQIWLLLDGLDEMTSRVETRHVSALLGGWVQAARVVVTCRVNVWEADKNAFSGFDVFRNLEFNPEQVTDYIRRWFAMMGDAATGESLEAALAQSGNSRLKELIQNPLRLWMLCQIWQTGGGLPETQAGLYGQFVDWVYDWKADEEILDQREAIDKALAQLALVAMEQKDEVSRLRLRESWVLKVLGSRPIFQAVMKLGWLNRVEQFPERICVFYHATFQEYFAALAVEDWDYFLPRNHVNFPVAGKEYRIFESQWKQVILLWLGRGDVAKGEKEEFIEKLVKFDDGCGEWNFEEADRGFYEYRAYFLAAAGIGEFKTCSLADAIVQKVVKWCFGYFNDEKQEWQRFIIENSEILPQSDQQRIIQELYQLLEQSQYPEVIHIHTLVADSLEKIDPGNPKARAAWLKLFEISKDESTRKRASFTVQFTEPEQRNVESIAALVKVLETSKDEKTRRNAAESLGKIAHDNYESIAALVNVLETSKDEDTRWLAAKTLGNIKRGNPQTIAALVTVLETSEDEKIRGQVAKALGNIRRSNPQTIAALVTVLETSKDEFTCYQVAESLGKIGHGNSDATAALVKVLATSKNAFTCQQATRSLGEIGHGNSDAITALVKVLETFKDEETLVQAAESLGKIEQSNT